MFQTSFYKYLDSGYVAFSAPLMQEVLVYVLIAAGGIPASVIAPMNMSETVHGILLRVSSQKVQLLMLLGHIMYHRL